MKFTKTGIAIGVLVMFWVFTTLGFVIGTGAAASTCKQQIAELETVWKK